MSAYDSTGSPGQQQSGFIELRLEPELSARLIEHDCRYRLDGAHYLPDGTGLVLALGRRPGDDPDVIGPKLVAIDGSSGATLYEAELPRSSFISSIDVSDDGTAVFVAHSSYLGQFDEMTISRYDVESVSFETVFDNFQGIDIKFVEFAGVSDETVLFVAAKEFQRLTNDDVEILGPPYFQMIDVGYLLFETTDDSDVVDLSRFYPMLRDMLEAASDSSKIWGSLIYYMGAEIRRSFGQYDIAFDVYTDGAESPHVIHRFDDGVFVPLLDPDMHFDRFAVSPDGTRIVVIDSVIDHTVTLFEKIDGDWTSRSLNATLDSVASLDACSQ